MTKNKTLLLSRTEVQSLIDLPEICIITEETLRAHGQRKVVLPAKITLDINPTNHQAWMNAMPAYVQPLNAAGIKWAGGFIYNPRDYDLPYVMASIIMTDPATGQNLAVLDGTYITNARTGATAAVSAKYLTRRSSRIVAIIGAGTQGRWTLRALHQYFELEEVHIVDVRLDAVESFKREMGAELGLPIVEYEYADEASKDADLIFTATTADHALVHNENIRPGATVISLGSYQELDDRFTLTADKVIVDDLGQAMHRGELAHLFENEKLEQADIYCELGDVVGGNRLGRQSATERILVVPIGLGSIDIAIAHQVMTKAFEADIGQRFDFSA